MHSLVCDVKELNLVEVDNCKKGFQKAKQHIHIVSKRIRYPNTVEYLECGIFHQPKKQLFACVWFFVEFKCPFPTGLEKQTTRCDGCCVLDMEMQRFHLLNLARFSDTIFVSHHWVFPQNSKPQKQNYMRVLPDVLSYFFIFFSLHFLMGLNFKSITIQAITNHFCYCSAVLYQGSQVTTFKMDRTL